jgi:hypothetical protein
MFDPVWIVAYMFGQGAFKYKVCIYSVLVTFPLTNPQTINELIDSTDFELKIVKPDKPL